MISKTLLATNPRHRPIPDATAEGWLETRPGQWLHRCGSVTLEIDGLWHSYAQATETRRNSPGFLNLADAMRDVQMRAMEILGAA